MTSLSFDTGNVTTIPEIVTKRHNNSSQEVLAVFRHFSKSADVDLVDGVYRLQVTPDVDAVAADVKITLKVFLLEFSVKDVLKAIDIFFEQKKFSKIHQFIVAFPYSKAEDLNNAVWLEKVLDIWKELEELVDDGKIFALGVADVDADRLKLLVDNTKKHPPTIDHYSIDGCCTVPADLVEYAKSRDILLLTHNDTRNFELSPEIKDLAAKNVEAVQNYTQSWTARYSVWLRSRSIIVSKGYIVTFKHL